MRNGTNTATVPKHFFTVTVPWFIVNGTIQLVKHIQYSLKYENTKNCEDPGLQWGLLVAYKGVETDFGNY